MKLIGLCNTDLPLWTLEFIKLLLTYTTSYCNPLLPLLPLIPPVRVSGITKALTTIVLVPESQHHFSLVIYSTIIAVYHSLLSSTYGC